MAAQSVCLEELQATPTPPARDRGISPSGRGGTPPCLPDVPPQHNGSPKSAGPSEQQQRTHEYRGPWHRTHLQLATLQQCPILIVVTNTERNGQLLLRTMGRIRSRRMSCSLQSIFLELLDALIPYSTLVVTGHSDHLHQTCVLGTNIAKANKRLKNGGLQHTHGQLMSFCYNYPNCPAAPSLLSMPWTVWAYAFLHFVFKQKHALAPADANLLSSSKPCFHPLFHSPRKYQLSFKCCGTMIRSWYTLPRVSVGLPKAHH